MMFIAPADLPAEPATAAWTWAASAGVSEIQGGAGDGHERSLGLRGQGAWGSLAAEVLHADRFGRNDNAWALDAYPHLWQGAYANLRYQQAQDDRLYPHTAWRGELYQNVGDGWELAASHDVLGFNDHVNINAVAVGKYVGNWYLRLRHQQVKSSGNDGSGQMLLARYYYRGDADKYLEFNFSNGRSDAISNLLAGPTQSNTRGLVWNAFVSRDWGLKLAWTEARTSGAQRERNLNVGLTRRW